MSEDKDWVDIRRHAINAARRQGVPEGDVEDAAQYVCERLWIDGDWGRWNDGTVIFYKVIDFIRQHTGRSGEKYAFMATMFRLDDTIPSAENPDYLVPVTDDYPFLREIPEIEYGGRGVCQENVDKNNFIIAAIAMGVTQRAIADFLGITETAICHRLKTIRKYVNKEDLLP